MKRIPINQNKKILITHVYSKDNSGDAALTFVLINEIKRVFLNPRIILLTIDKIKNNERFEGVPVESAFLRFVNNSSSNKIIKFAVGIYVIIATLLWAVFYRVTKISLPINSKLKKICYSYSTADLIIPVGGGYLRTDSRISSTYVLIMLVHPLIFSKILGKPVVLYSQSIGPFSRRVDRILIKWAIKHTVELALVREKNCESVLKKMNVKNIARSVDAGFLFKNSAKTDVLEPLNGPTHRLLIGITVRRWLDDEGQLNYETSIAKLADHLIERHAAIIIFIPQVTDEFHNDDDRVVSRSVYSKMKNKDDARVIEQNYDFKYTISMYSDLNFIIGTRFHSIVFSLTSYVPAIAIEYEPKTSGIMADLGLENWVLKIEEVSPQILILKADELIRASRSYKTHLYKVMPTYEKKVGVAIEMTSRAYESFLINRKSKFRAGFNEVKRHYS